ncbi:MAG: exosortase C-terminal domain/associated protein EpsI [Desulfobacter sp.]
MSFFRTAIIVVILLATAGLTQVATRSENIRPNLPFDAFPLDLGTWKGVRSSLDDRVFNILGVEDYVMADYRNLEGQGVNLYVGFYQSQRQGDIIHSPKNCLPGAGWKIVDIRDELIHFKGQSDPTRVAGLLLKKGGASQVALYWYQSRGRIIASEYWQKIWLTVDAITKQRTDGSFVRLIAPVVEDETLTLERVKDFAKKIKPYLDAHIPS